MRNVLRHRRRRDEAGAIAIIVAVMAVSLFVLAGFTVDFGQAYVSKRQLQTASDSAALAAAAAYADYPGNCTTLKANATALKEAQDAADRYRDDNRPDTDGADHTIDVSCKNPVTGATDGQLYVTVRSTGSTSTVFASLAGGPSSIRTSRTATAAIGVPPDALQLRPWPVCSGQEIQTTPSQVVEVGYPANGHKPPPACSTNASGDWWRLQCPGGAGDNNASIDAVKNGCANPVSVIPNQPMAPATPKVLGDFLRANCTPSTSSCLYSDTGSSLKNLAGAWATVLGKTIIIPVFCDKPECDGETVVGNGSNARWPVYKLAAVTVCGYYLGGVASSDTLPLGDCRDKNPNGYEPSDFPDSKNDVKHNGFLLIFHNYIASGTTTPATCKLGDTTCDGGLRRVILAK